MHGEFEFSCAIDYVQNYINSNLQPILITKLEHLEFEFSRVFRKILSTVAHICKQYDSKKVEIL